MISTEGLKIIHANEPDFILLDVDMTGGSGFDLIEALGKNNLPIFFTTASNQHAIKALKIKATDYLLKPIDIDELSEAISKVKVQILNHIQAVQHSSNIAESPGIASAVVGDIKKTLKSKTVHVSVPAGSDENKCFELLKSAGLTISRKVVSSRMYSVSPPMGMPPKTRSLRIAPTCCSESFDVIRTSHVSNTITYSSISLPSLNFLKYS